MHMKTVFISEKRVPHCVMCKFTTFLRLLGGLKLHLNIDRNYIEIMKVC